MRIPINIKYIDEYSLLVARRQAIMSDINELLFWNNRRTSKRRRDSIKTLDKRFEQLTERINEIESLTLGGRNGKETK